MEHLNAPTDLPVIAPVPGPASEPHGRRVGSRSRSTINTYLGLAEMMSSDPDLVIFRRFKSLNVETLLYQQAEILHLQQALREIRLFELERLEHNPGRTAYDYMCNWSDLKEMSEGGETKTLQIVLEIRTKLSEYNAALLQYKAICNLRQPQKSSLGRLFEWLRLFNFLRGIEADAYQDANDMLSMSDKDLERTLWPERIYERLLVMLGSRRNCLFKRLTKPLGTDGVLFIYKTAFLNIVYPICAFTFLFSVLAGSLFALHFVDKVNVRLALVVVFSIWLFASLLVFTRTSYTTIVQSTVVYAAVQAIFVGTISPRSP